MVCQQPQTCCKPNLACQGNSFQQAQWVLLACLHPCCGKQLAVLMLAVLIMRCGTLAAEEDQPSPILDRAYHYGCLLLLLLLLLSTFPLEVSLMCP